MMYMTADMQSAYKVKLNFHSVIELNTMFSYPEFPRETHFQNKVYKKGKNYEVFVYAPYVESVDLKINIML